MGVVAFVSSTIGRMRNSYTDQSAGQLTLLSGMALGSVCGVIPLLMHGRYMALALHLHM
jgi:hypothetical protein